MPCLSRFGSLVIVGLVAASAMAQVATDAQRGPVPKRKDFYTMHLKANLGSFKLIDGRGRVEINFEGTILVSQLSELDGLKSSVTVSGELQKQYDKRGKQVYYGKGRIVVVGSWRGIQWFGKNMTGVWYGSGVARVAGLFDKELNPGELWYDDPKKITYWPASNTIDHRLPPFVTNQGQASPPPEKG